MKSPHEKALNKSSKLGSSREIKDSMGRHVFTRIKEHDGWKTYKAKKGGVDEHA